MELVRRRSRARRRHSGWPISGAKAAVRWHANAGWGGAMQSLQLGLYESKGIRFDPPVACTVLGATQFRAL